LSTHGSQQTGGNGGSAWGWGWGDDIGREVGGDRNVAGKILTLIKAIPDALKNLSPIVLGIFSAGN